MKRFCVLSAILLIVSLLCSCSTVGTKQVTYNGSQPIPDNGILTAEVLERIIADNSVSEFCGNCGEYEYIWYFFGSEINDTKDINLLLNIEKKNNGYSLAFQSEEDFGFKCYLSVSDPVKYENTMFSVFLENGDKTDTVAISAVNDKTIIKFSPAHQYGSLLLMPTEEQETETREEVTTTEEELAETETSAVTTTQETTVPVTSPATTIPVTTAVSTTSPATTAAPTTTAPATTVPATTAQVDTCTISIECSTIFSNLSSLEANKLSQLPADGIILKKTEVEIKDGDTVFSVLQRVCRENGIHLEYSSNNAFNSVYIEGIHNLYEFDCGELSGWMYRVNGWYPNYGCSNYSVRNGDIIEFRYTCDLGADVGGGFN